MTTNDEFLLGIIGQPVAHSLSPAMHQAALDALGLRGRYVLVEADSLATSFAHLREQGFTGASVTVPYKVEVMALVDELDATARAIGAVNTLHFTQPSQPNTAPEGMLLCSGSNTDWLGAVRALEAEIALPGASVLLLGAGGSARAIGYGLVQAGTHLTLTNRSEPKGRALAEELGCVFVPQEFLTELLANVRFEVLINSTSVGMSLGPAHLPLPEALLPRFPLVMDIVYAPLNTALLQAAAARGCTIIDGLQMLLHQGAAQFELWTGQQAPLTVMREALLTALQRR